MKKIILFAVIFVAIGCNNSQKINGSFNLNEKSQKYGDENITEDGAISGEDLISILELKDSAQVKVQGIISAVCQKKGCWMYIDLDPNNQMLVKFLDYGFFVPLDASGKTAIVEGMAKIDTLTVAWLKHQAEDANASKEEIDAINKIEIAYSIEEATGVILK